MSINIASNFELFAALPLDDRTVAANIAARDAITSGQRYEGLWCYVVDSDGGGTPATYQLQNGITNSDWVLIGSGAAITGSGAVNRLAIWTTPSALTSNANLSFPTTTQLLRSENGVATNFNVNVERWVATTGSDSNDGATALTPWLTLEHAMQQCPKLGSGRYLIHVANGTYANTAFSVPAFESNLDFGEGFSTFIHIQGDPGTPSNVVLQNTAAIMGYHNQPNVILFIEGVRFEGDPAQVGLQVTAGILRMSDCEIDNYQVFAQNSDMGQFITDSTITLTDTYTLVLNRFGSVQLNSDIIHTPPTPLTSDPITVTSYGGVVVHRTGDITMTCPALAAQGALFYFDNTQFLLGQNSVFTVNDGDAFMYCENSIGKSGDGNAVYVNSGNSLFSLIGNSNFIDGTNTLWRSNSSLTFVIPMSTGARFTSPNFTEAGTLPGPFIAGNDLVTYVNYQNPVNYYAASDDNRYVDVSTFTCLGVLPQGGSLMLIGPAGISSAEQYIKTVERTEQLLGIRVYTGVANGAAHTDTYFAYVNGASSGLSVALTNTATNSATAASLITLSAGDRISVRCTSDAATAAENITVEVLTRKRL